MTSDDEDDWLLDLEHYTSKKRTTTIDAFDIVNSNNFNSHDITDELFEDSAEPTAAQDTSTSIVWNNTSNATTATSDDGDCSESLLLNDSLWGYSDTSKFRKYRLIPSDDMNVASSLQQLVESTQASYDCSPSPQLSQPLSYTMGTRIIRGKKQR